MNTIYFKKTSQTLKNITILKKNGSGQFTESAPTILGRFHFLKRKYFKNLVQGDL